MTELAINKLRRDILDACAAESSHGAPEHKWAWDDESRGAIKALLQQKLITREMGDVGRSFGCRLRLTDRGWAAVRGEHLTKL